MTTKTKPTYAREVKKYAKILRELGANNVPYEEDLQKYVDNPNHLYTRFTQLRKTLFERIEYLGIED